MNVINYHLTNLCNYDCTHCFGKFPDLTELTFEQACKVVDNNARYFSKKGIKGRINLAGGEPLLCKYLDDLIDYINLYGIQVSIITNGSLLTEERIARWKDKVYCIGLSIDSALSETNKAIGRCCNGKTLTVKQAVRITQAIHRCGIMLKINTVVSKLNVNEDMTELYKRLKPDRLKLLQMELVEGVNDRAKNLAVGKKAFERFYERHKNFCRKTVPEYSDDMENSYLMINPQGQVQLNNNGKYEIFGSCLEEDLDDILTRTPFDSEKFDARYGKEIDDGIIDKDVCIFGGHPSWIKGLKKRMLNAKFFKDGNLHSLDVIRNSEEIWIQPNAISHSFYGKIMEVARTNGIPVRYFGFAGTKKCLEQVVLKQTS